MLSKVHPRRTRTIARDGRDMARFIALFSQKCPKWIIHRKLRVPTSEGSVLFFDTCSNLGQLCPPCRMGSIAPRSRLTRTPSPLYLARAPSSCTKNPAAAASIPSGAVEGERGFAHPTDTQQINSRASKSSAHRRVGTATSLYKQNLMAIASNSDIISLEGV